MLIAHSKQNYNKTVTQIPFRNCFISHAETFRCRFRDVKLTLKRFSGRRRPHSKVHIRNSWYRFTTVLAFYINRTVTTLGRESRWAFYTPILSTRRNQRASIHRHIAALTLSRQEPSACKTDFASRGWKTGRRFYASNGATRSNATRRIYSACDGMAIALSFNRVAMSVS